jgi:hypothetical protein
MYRKNQIFYRTGFSVPLINKKKVIISLNPFGSFSITSAIRDDKNKRHFVNYGVGLKIIIPSKK